MTTKRKRKKRKTYKDYGYAYPIPKYTTLEKFRAKVARAMKPRRTSEHTGGQS